MDFLLVQHPAMIASNYIQERIGSSSLYNDYQESGLPMLGIRQIPPKNQSEADQVKVKPFRHDLTSPGSLVEIGPPKMGVS